MTIDYKILIGEDLSENQKASVEMVLTQTFEEVNAIYNKWNPRSELSQINRLPAGQKVRISHKLAKLLALADQVVKWSGGLFDPTIEPVLQLWKKHLYFGKIPSEEELKSLKPAIGWDKIHVQDGWFWKDHNLTSMDLSGIAKGLGVDLLIENLNQEGYHNVLVEWGGEIRVSGEHPDHRPWQVYITRFGNTQPDTALAKISLHDQAVATSGDYEQFWKVEVPSKEKGQFEVVTFFHIINPFTLRPLEITPRRVSSSSVLAPRCALADALATVALVFDTIEQAEQWADQMEKTIPDITFWLATRQENP